MQTRNEKQVSSRQPTKGFKGVLFNGEARYGKVLDPPYEAGKTYTNSSKKKLRLCSNTGIHFCQKAEDVWNYYAPSVGKYIEVSAPGKCVSLEGPGTDSKIATRKLTLGKRFMGALAYARKFFQGMYAKSRLISDVAGTGVLYVYNKSNGKASTNKDVVGYGMLQCLEGRTVMSYSCHSYNYGRLVAIGYGYNSVTASDLLAVTVRDGLAYAAGKGAIAITRRQAAGVLGSVLVFLWNYSDSPAEFPIVKSFEVDGKTVMPNTVYHLNPHTHELVKDSEMIDPLEGED